ncbi:methyltransferase [Actinoplanes sp. LDG1-06]|uniref:Methyltransferase n=1 Tax=Paractinoplanes ovalisporus TaxID=2810368 RepID=A0ABS2A2P2_9ACTN|nr:methyltransferase domain-containing protein [Actinoplanes ovalisporus]MBM2614097.1 methyltransferase [Actinoplanes ovalisporus]
MFEQMVAEAVEVPLTGWDFRWLEGRASGSAPSWSYPELAAELVGDCASLIDVDTGGGELLSSLAPLPARTVAVEGWAPNVPVARERLAPLRVDVRFRENTHLPVDDGSADLMLNRHGHLEPAEAARVLAAGGVLLTQQVGSDDCSEINEALGAPPAYDEAWNADVAVRRLTAAGLTILDVREERPAFTFYDIGALVFQLRAVPWQVRDFTVARYEQALRRIDSRIRADGEFRVHSHRFLVRARKR